MGKTGQNFSASYQDLAESGRLAERVKRAYRQMENCDLCARYCHVNRRQSIRGAVCRTGEHAVVHSYGPHHGEEDPLRGSRGSGTNGVCSSGEMTCGPWGGSSSEGITCPSGSTSG